ncbi:membrane protein [Vibrio coralliilyticus]|uniref:Membrane protein n=1 Tax=Vibrio coralliilyticus TaxID=190893 RepID=A0A837G6R7_9VIBR|nr:phosphatase PAP2 family protein [Vibrio coralliilyticus]KJY77422.1 membrane protein [Vibrio coralliilyticus]QOU30112.1 phosphatase PAP2 family protein [Vibrio coralliilyticus]
MEPLIQTSQSSQWQHIKTALYQDRFLYGYVFVTTLLLYALSFLLGNDTKFDFNPFIYLATLVQVCYVSFLVWASGYFLYLLYHKTPHPLAHFFQAIKGFFQPLSKAVSFILLVLALNLTFSSYTFLKPLIPEINPFQYDVLFYDLDKWLHLGYSPWELTHSLFSSAFATSLLNFLYHLWFLLMWGSVLFFIVRRDLTKLRTQFLITFLTSWLLIGGVGAILLSSAGPCYLHLLDPQALQYEQLMQRLEVQNQQLIQNGWFGLWALNVQDTLWQMHISEEPGIGGGISAMPSMHVAIAVAMALAAYRYNRKLGVVMWSYALTIQIGSVHLAWHYAIDGYLSFILTIVIWKLVGWLQTRFRRTITSQLV